MISNPLRKRVLSGVKPTGKAHLGNYLGAMRNHVNMQYDYESYIFIADMHSLTTVKNAKELQNLIIDIALDYLALGLDPEKSVFFRQSDVHEHSELAWILNCVTPMSMLELAHAYKDAVAKGIKEINAGLFDYPVLMAADILIYKPDLVPVGQDQKQHVEITRDIAGKFNRIFGEVFKLPEPFIPREVAVVIGTDGQKMSKSYGNIIEIFAPEKLLKKQVMGIVTDSSPMEEPKDPDKDTVFKLYSYFANGDEKKSLAEKYRAGGFGYGDAKKLLLGKVIEHFEPFRKKREELVKNLDYVKDVLSKGAEKAREVAGETLREVKEKVMLNSTMSNNNLIYNSLMNFKGYQSNSNAKITADCWFIGREENWSANYIFELMKSKYQIKIDDFKEYLSPIKEFHVINDNTNSAFYKGIKAIYNLLKNHNKIDSNSIFFSNILPIGLDPKFKNINYDFLLSRVFNKTKSEFEQDCGERLLNISQEWERCKPAFTFIFTIDRRYKEMIKTLLNIDLIDNEYDNIERYIYKKKDNRHIFILDHPRYYKFWQNYKNFLRNKLGLKDLLIL